MDVREIGWERVDWLHLAETSGSIKGGVDWLVGWLVGRSVGRSVG
jgi:hypothetical protein